MRLLRNTSYYYILKNIFAYKIVYIIRHRNLFKVNIMLLFLLQFF